MTGKMAASESEQQQRERCRRSDMDRGGGRERGVTLPTSLKRVQVRLHPIKL